MKNKFEQSQEFVTKNNYSIEYIPLSEVTNINKFIDGDKRSLVKYNKQTTITGHAASQVSYSKQLLVHNEVLNKILANPENFEKIIDNKDNINKNPILLVMDEFINVYREQGVYGIPNQILGEKDAAKPHDFTESNVFDNANQPGFQFIQFIENKNSVRAVMDKEGKFTVEPMLFDYIGADLNNGAYELDSLVEHLMKRDDVTFVVEERFSYNKNKLLKCPLKGDEDGLSDIISDIPSYNADEDKNESIQIIYYPKAEDIPKIMNWEMSNEDQKNKAFTLERFIVQNILGCQKFRKDNAPEPDEPEVPKRKFKR